MLVAHTNPSSQQSLWSDSPALKWGMTAFSVTVLAVGILGAVYGMCSFIPSVQTAHIFTPLSNFVPSTKIVLVLSGGALAGLGVIVIIQIHKNRNQLSESVRESLPKLENIASQTNEPKIKQCIGEIEKILKKGYKLKRDYYSFYYYLANVSECVKNDNELKEQWKNFLRSIDGAIIVGKNGGQGIRIDCTTEFNRLEGSEIQLFIKEVKDLGPRRAAAVKEDIQTIGSIFQEAFEGVDGQCNWMFESQRKNRCFVVCSDKKLNYVIPALPGVEFEKDEILGCIFLEEKEIPTGKTLFVHSLARRAAAVKLGMTEKFKEHLTEMIQAKKYAEINCTVDKANTAAVDIYRKLGFRTTGRGHVERGGKHVMFMRYDPLGKDKDVNYFR
ncbi:MAG TPA: GNAT family N-acetyltransferase [Waddliaceae bacterium]